MSFEEIIERIQEKREAVADVVIRGGMSDAQYNSCTGEIKGYDAVLSILKEIQKKYMDDED